METIVVQPHIYKAFLSWSGACFEGRDPVQDINILLKSVRWHAEELKHQG